MAGGEHGGGRHAPRLLQCLDSHTAVFHARWRASGWVAALLAPRDAVLRRSWRCGPGLAARQAGAGRLVQAALVWLQAGQATGCCGPEIAILAPLHCAVRFGRACECADRRMHGQVMSGTVLEPGCKSAAVSARARPATLVLKSRRRRRGRALGRAR